MGRSVGRACWKKIVPKPRRDVGVFGTVEVVEIVDVGVVAVTLKVGVTKGGEDVPSQLMKTRGFRTVSDEMQWVISISRIMRQDERGREPQEPQRRSNEVDKQRETSSKKAGRRRE